LVSNPKSNPRSILSCFLSIISELDRFQIFALGLYLLAIHGVNVARRGLRFPMAEHRLNHRGMNLVRPKECRQAVPQIVPSESRMIILADHASDLVGVEGDKIIVNASSERVAAAVSAQLEKLHDSTPVDVTPQ
jgi:hypothetical protein